MQMMPDYDEDNILLRLLIRVVNPNDKTQIDMNKLENVLCEYISYNKIEGCKVNKLKLDMSRVRLTGWDITPDDTQRWFNSRKIDDEDPYLKHEE